MNDFADSVVAVWPWLTLALVVVLTGVIDSRSPAYDGRYRPLTAWILFLLTVAAAGLTVYGFGQLIL